VRCQPKHSEGASPREEVVCPRTNIQPNVPSRGLIELSTISCGSPPISKKQLLAEMQSEQAAWLALLDEIGEENMTQPEVAGGWSIKDIVAHITGWRRRTVLRFRAALDPTIDMTPPWPAELGELDEDDDVDEINAWIYKTNRDRPLADVLNDSREVFQQLVTEVSALPR
jgi:hypothetical protein